MSSIPFYLIKAKRYLHHSFGYSETIFLLSKKKLLISVKKKARLLDNI